MGSRKIVKYLIGILLVLITSILAAIFAGTLGFMFSFLLFGDGSELYFWLKKSLYMEPYAFMAIIFSIIAFLSIWVLAFAMLKNGKYKI